MQVLGLQWHICFTYYVNTTGTCVECCSVFGTSKGMNFDASVDICVYELDATSMFL